jgi:hypothetical protein
MGESRSDKSILALYSGLKSLYESSFPKKCATCGRIFITPEEFIAESLPVPSGSGLKSSMDDDDTPVVELFRNCLCGSTLMDVFSDRRDLSERGLMRRKKFSEIQNLLIKKGLSPEDARIELLKVMRGENSPIIDSFGVITGKKQAV